MKRILSLLLCIAMCLSFVACGGKEDSSTENKDNNASSNVSGDADDNTGNNGGSNSGDNPDALVIMTDQLDGLFNPFFSTSAADGTIVAMTQIGMLTSTYDEGKKEVEVGYGDDEAVVVKDYDETTNDDGTVTYRLVLKNGILFSDGHPLTMEDVLFNYYVYLDPVYTGSNTLYSTKIVGLKEYRTQQVSSSTGNADSLIASQANDRAELRRNELINIYSQLTNSTANTSATYDEMVEAIEKHTLSSGYISAISNDPSKVTNDDLKADYDRALELFKEELESDYLSAQESYNDAPFSDHEEFDDEIFCFMFSEGLVQIEYEKGADGKDDKTKYKSFTKNYSNVSTKEEAINYVYTVKTESALDEILLYWATANTLISEFSAKATEVILKENAKDGELLISSISGLVSLGHTDAAGTTIKMNNAEGKEYKIASAHNDDGTVTNADEYDVLQITLEGVDPKAIWNFAIPIAPQHYYGEDSTVGVDIANNKFGVEYASFEFMSSKLQSIRNVRLPMGAGSYKVTNSSNEDKPEHTEFYSNNVVYFKANNNFHTVGTGIENAKIEKVRYQVVSSNNAISALENNSVHYISPALTDYNFTQLANLSSQGVVTITSDQLGYGYIGVNSAKINDINLRKAIMCAMNTSLALDYYRDNTCSRIFWPMSTVSWAYPKNADGSLLNDNGKDYPQLGKWSDEVAKANITSYMQMAGVSAGDSKLKVTFTIAGSNLQDHPTYKVFRDAEILLESLGWDIEVVCDIQALTKINTGALEVWAAAWSSALDPDLYQVYHKNSTATSTKAWGYNYLKNSGTQEELKILDDLSVLIEDARATTDKAVRSDLYERAMGLILDLAVELPVYQRDVLYAYNSKVINSDSLPENINPYSSPLDRIWELEFAF